MLMGGVDLSSQATKKDSITNTKLAKKMKDSLFFTICLLMYIYLFIEE